MPKDNSCNGADAVYRHEQHDRHTLYRMHSPISGGLSGLFILEVRLPADSRLTHLPLLHCLTVSTNMLYPMPCVSSWHSLYAVYVMSTSWGMAKVAEGQAVDEIVSTPAFHQ
jgi:hypothetical protein